MGYRGNIGSLLENLAVYQREDHSKRIRKEVALSKKNNILPTKQELIKKYSIADHEAERLLNGIKRKINNDLRFVRDVLATQGATPAAAMKRHTDTEPPSELTEFVPPTATAQDEPILCKSAQEALSVIREKYGEEIRRRGEQTSIPEGFIYLVTHPLFVGWVKAGMTIDFEQRLITYNIADPLRRFTLAAVKWVPNRRQAENLLIELMSTEAEQENGEWFFIPIIKALVIFERDQLFSQALLTGVNIPPRY